MTSIYSQYGEMIASNFTEDIIVREAPDVYMYGR